MYISEKIKDEYKRWSEGDLIFIDAGVDSGKSYFIRNVLSNWAAANSQQILLLVNRIELKKQVNTELKRLNINNIKVETYQKLEHDKNFDFLPYTYIVCDECHYFIEDSSFNHNSDMSLNMIKKLETHIRILMSATGDTIFKHLQVKSKREPIHYRFPRDFSNILSLSFYKNEKSNNFSTEQVEYFVKNRFPYQNDKIIWFCRTVEQAARLHKKYPDSSFMCSRSQTKYTKLIAKDLPVNDDDKITFSGKWLFTTNVLDNGFDFKDENIKLIVCDYPDTNTVLQCIGRKRKLHDKDNVHIVLSNYGNQSISGKVRSTTEALQQAQAIIDDDLGEYYELVGRFGDKSKFIVLDKLGIGKSIEKKISYPKWLKVTADHDIYSSIQNESRELNKFRELNNEKREDDGYKQYMSKQLGQSKFYDLCIQPDLSEYFGELVGIRLFKAEQHELINKFNVKADGKLLKSYTSLNSALIELGLNYKIVSDKDKRRKLDDGSDNPNRLKTYWIIQRTV